MFKKLRMWFWTKTRTIEEIIQISKIMDIHNKNLAESLEELDQEKVYICKLPGASQEEVNMAKQAIQEAAKQMRWTVPKILFLNAEIEEQKKQRSVKRK